MSEDQFARNAADLLGTITCDLESRRLSLLAERSLQDVLNSTSNHKLVTQYEKKLIEANKDLSELENLLRLAELAIAETKAAIDVPVSENEHPANKLAEEKNYLKELIKTRTKLVEKLETSLVGISITQEQLTRAENTLMKESNAIKDVHDALVDGLINSLGVTRLETIGAGYKALRLKGDKTLHIFDVLNYISISIANKPKMKLARSRELEKKIDPLALKFIYSKGGCDVFARFFARVMEIKNEFHRGGLPFTNQRMVDEMKEAMDTAAVGHSNPLKDLIHAVPLLGENPEDLSTWYSLVVRVVTDYNMAHNSNTITPTNPVFSAAAATGAGGGGGGTAAALAPSPAGNKDQARFQKLMSALRTHFSAIRKLPTANNYLICPFHPKDNHDVFNCQLCIECADAGNVKWKPN